MTEQASITLKKLYQAYLTQKPSSNKQWILAFPSDFNGNETDKIFKELQGYGFVITHSIFGKEPNVKVSCDITLKGLEFCKSAFDN